MMGGTMAYPALVLRTTCLRTVGVYSPPNPLSINIEGEQFSIIWLTYV